MLDLRRLITGQRLAGASLDDTIRLLSQIDRNSTQLISDMEIALSLAQEIFREDDAPLLDITGDGEPEIDVRLPFELHRWVKVLPRNIIIIAGVSNAGKTAFMLNTVQLNQDRFPGVYFSSEMSEAELRERLNRFPSGTKWKWEFRERDYNFAEVIRPDCINIIDWLEINSEFYSIGELIKQIYSRLNNGVCFIAIQKGDSAQLGTGGQYSTHKARLYLSIDNDRLTVIKAKIPRYSDVIPRGWEYRFSIKDGWNFTITQKPFECVHAEQRFNSQLQEVLNG